jgi:hypothetical protein
LFLAGPTHHPASLRLVNGTQRSIARCIAADEREPPAGRHRHCCHVGVKQNANRQIKTGTDFNQSEWGCMIRARESQSCVPGQVRGLASEESERRLAKKEKNSIGFESYIISYNSAHYLRI